MEATKNVPIGNAQYQIGRVDADTGSWLLFQVLSAMRQALKNEVGTDEPTPQPEAKLSPEEEAKKIEDAIRIFAPIGI